jgi:flagellin
VSFRIASNVVPIQAARNLTQAQTDLDRSLSALSSGSRINRAGDDAAGYAIAESLRGQVGGTKQAQFNARTAENLIQTAEGGLSEQNNILVRLRELAVYAASDTIGDEERGYLDNEFQQLSSEFDRIAKSTRYGNKELLTGSGENFEFQVGAYKGPENIVTFKLDADTTGSAVGIAGLDVESKSSARSALDDLDEAITKVAGVRATFGGVQSRLEHTQNALSVQAENLEAARSNIMDVDAAEESTKLAQAQVRQEAAISVIAQANSANSRVLRLLNPI